MMKKKAQNSQILDEMEMGDRVRLKHLKDDIVRKQSCITQEHYDSEGNLTHKVVTTSPNTQRLKAIDLANKMSGLYDKNRSTANAYGRELSTLIKKFRPGNKAGEGEAETASGGSGV